MVWNWEGWNWVPCVSRSGKMEKKPLWELVLFGVAQFCSSKRPRKPLPYPVQSMWSECLRSPSATTPSCFFHCLTDRDSNALFSFLFLCLFALLEWRTPEIKDVQVIVGWFLVDFSPWCSPRRNPSCVDYWTNALGAEWNSPGLTSAYIISRGVDNAFFCSWVLEPWKQAASWPGLSSCGAVSFGCLGGAHGWVKDLLSVPSTDLLELFQGQSREKASLRAEWLSGLNSDKPRQPFKSRWYEVVLDIKQECSSSSQS